MTKSFREPYVRVPNFGIEGARPQRWPEWVDRNWRIVPPASPPWTPPPSPPQDGTDPFRDMRQMPAPPRPNPEGERGPGGSNLLDWLLGQHRAEQSRSRNQRPTAPGFDEPLPDFLDRRPWRLVQPDGYLSKTLPFDSKQLDALLRLRPEELVTLTEGTSSNGRTVQPPIFFPFD